MPKEEAPVPWAVSHAATSGTYPRKNIYFLGVGAEDVYNYCIWRTHIAGHTTLENKKARGISAFIVDVLTRRYLDEMLDPDTFAAFAEWASADYRADIQLKVPEPRLLAISKMLRSWPKRSELVGTLEEWKLSSKDYQLLKRFCSVFTEIFGPMFEDVNDAEQAS
jgi:hypothetical protein